MTSGYIVKKLSDEQTVTRAFPQVDEVVFNGREFKIIVKGVIHLFPVKTIRYLKVTE